MPSKKVSGRASSRADRDGKVLLGAHVQPKLRKLVKSTAVALDVPMSRFLIRVCKLGFRCAQVADGAMREQVIAYLKGKGQLPVAIRQELVAGLFADELLLASRLECPTPIISARLSPKVEPQNRVLLGDP
jgi:hypothetical protein